MSQILTFFTKNFWGGLDQVMYGISLYLNVSFILFYHKKFIYSSPYNSVVTSHAPLTILGKLLPYEYVSSSLEKWAKKKFEKYNNKIYKIFSKNREKI